MDTLLVSAFFDIGRGESNISGMKRSNKKYFEYFSVWARMKNILVVYTQSEFVEDIIRIREKFGLKEKTKVYTIDDISSIEPEILYKMNRVERLGEWKNFRMYTNAMSNQALYDYVMLIKYWCMADATKRLEFKGNVAWMDFGFNHGNECYIDKNDFDFLWEPKLEKGIHLFVKKNPDKNNIMGTLLLQSDCVMGSPVILYSDRCELLWNYCKEAMNALLLMEAIDDDQQLLLMAYKAHKEEFIIHYSDWFLPLKEYGGEHLKVKENYGIKNQNVCYRIKNVISRILFGFKKDYSRATAYNFGKRMEKYAKKNS